MGGLLVSADRRSSRRVLAGIPVELSIRGLPSNIQTSFSAEIADLSSRGASILLGNSIPVSSRVSLTLNLASPSRYLEADAEVVWNYFLPGDKKFNCGLRFLRMKKRYSRILEEFTNLKNTFCEVVPERRKLERRTKIERRTALIPHYSPECRRLRDRRYFDRRIPAIARLFQRLARLMLQFVFWFRK